MRFEIHSYGLGPQVHSPQSHRGTEGDGGDSYRLHIAYASRNVGFSTSARFTSK